MGISPKNLAQIKKHDFTKELKAFEYETKFNIKNKGLDSLEILKKIRSCFKDGIIYVEDNDEAAIQKIITWVKTIK